MPKLVAMFVMRDARPVTTVVRATTAVRAKAPVRRITIETAAKALFANSTNVFLGGGAGVGSVKPAFTTRAILKPVTKQRRKAGRRVVGVRVQEAIDGLRMLAHISRSAVFALRVIGTIPRVEIFHRACSRAVGRSPRGGSICVVRRVAARRHRRDVQRPSRERRIRAWVRGQDKPSGCRGGVGRSGGWVGVEWMCCGSAATSGLRRRQASAPFASCRALHPLPHSP